MPIQEALKDGATAFAIGFVVFTVIELVGIHDKGYFDWKDYRKGIIYSLVLGVAAFLGMLFRHR